MIINYDLAPGVHQIEHAYTNCYLVEGDDGVTIVDAAFRSTGRGMLTLLAAIGRSVADIRAVLLTHGHFDHVGFARGLQRQLRTPVWIHPADRRLAEHPYRYAPERNRLTFPLSHPGGLPLLGSMVAAGALAVQGVSADHDYTDGQAIPVPGRPHGPAPARSHAGAVRVPARRPRGAVQR